MTAQREESLLAIVKKTGKNTQVNLEQIVKNLLS
jgi:hypothetical protein